MLDSGAFLNSAFDPAAFDFGAPAVCAFDADAFSDSAFSSDAFGICGGGTTPPVVVVTEQPSGGYLAFVRYEQEALKRAHDRRKRQKDKEEAEALQSETDREIAAFLHQQEAQDAQRAELARLSGLAAEIAAHRAELDLNERVSHALARAIAQQNTSALLAFEREMDRMFEEEELAVMMALALDD